MFGLLYALIWPKRCIPFGYYTYIAMIFTKRNYLRFRNETAGAK